MPSTISQLFFPDRRSYKLQEGSVEKRMTRSKSFSFVSRHKHNIESTEVSSANEASPSKRLEIESPRRKPYALSSRRRNFSNRRPRTIVETGETDIAKSDENHNIALAERSTLLKSEEKRQRKNSFREVTRHLVPGLLQRSISFRPERKRKIIRFSTQSLSPLVTSSPPYNTASRSQTDNTNMGRLMTSDVISGTNGNRNEDSHPASVESFVRKCSDCFDDSGYCSNEHFVRILFLTHQWFMTSEQIMVLFTKLYEEEKHTEGYSTKVFHTIRFWMKEFPHIFDIDQKLVNALQNLQEISQDDPNVDRTLIDLNDKGSYKWIVQVSVKPSCLDRKQRKVSLIFNHLEPEELAIHMSYLEYNSFRRLTLSDFHNYAISGVLKDNKKLERAVYLFNNIAHWVQCMVLDHHNVSDRASAIVKFVKVAEKLHSMRNYNTLMGIIGALTHTTISRLKKTMAEVPKNTQKTLDEFVDLLDSKTNYSSYRRAYKNVTDCFKIPVIGILMKDFTALHAALPDRVGDGLINVKKMMMIGNKFEEIYRLQREGFPYTVNRDLVNTLRVSLYLYYNEEEIYQLSVTREPRDVKYSSSGLSSSPTKTINMGFAEFASFTCQLDDDTIKEHVTAMVGSVFKAYDQNSDGFISETEFGTFIKNFPGLDSFATVDADQDGRISKSEMVDYFLKISSSRRNQVCQSFKHEFIETTYFHPTFCEDCEKLLWGLVKQGWKCKDCGINCHKHCKDRIVLECRPKAETKHSNAVLISNKKREKRKAKASLSSESDLSLNGDPAKLVATAQGEDDAFETGDSKATNHVKTKKCSSLAAHASSLKASQQTFVKRRTKASSVASALQKPASPNFEQSTGRKFRPFNILTKKSSPRLTEKNPDSPKSPPRSRRFLRANVLYKKAHSFEDVSDPKTRENLREELEKSVQTRKNDDLLSKPISNGQVATDLNSAKLQLTKMTRQDSGVSSSCSCLPTPSTSTPDTPLLIDHKCKEFQFQYPPSPGLPTILTPDSTISKATIAQDKKHVIEQNEKLQQENEELRRELKLANDVIKELKTKLTNMQLT